MNIDELVTNYKNEGYSLGDARSTVCQDIILYKISHSEFKRHITIKGGVVMHSISQSIRRATQDLDIDFIRYSLEDNSIRNFIRKLNMLQDGIIIEIQGNIENLHHQDYDGKRVNIEFYDKFGNVLEGKLDIGVDKSYDIMRDEYYFNLNSISEGVSLLINSKEQIFAEKLKSLLKFGFRSTRYKDLFDIYFIINNTDININKVIDIFDILIFKDEKMYENNIHDVKLRLEEIFNSKLYRDHLSNPKYNWLDIDIDEAIKSVIQFIEELENIAVIS